MKTKREYIVIAVLMSVLLAGCGRSDRALSLAVPVGEEIVSAEEPAFTQEAEVQSMIYVHVCGAVATEGVVVLPEGSRGQDALDAAGGFAENAARNAVNLAGVVTDGMKLYFPTMDEYTEEMPAAGEDSGLVNINTAEAAALCTLPGIGESKAKAIIAYREANGSFESTEDIMKVSGIKENAYDKIKDLITVK